MITNNTISLVFYRGSEKKTISEHIQFVLSIMDIIVDDFGEYDKYVFSDKSFNSLDEVHKNTHLLEHENYDDDYVYYVRNGCETSIGNLLNKTGHYSFIEFYNEIEEINLGIRTGDHDEISSCNTIVLNLSINDFQDVYKFIDRIKLVFDKIYNSLDFYFASISSTEVDRFLDESCDYQYCLGFITFYKKIAPIHFSESFVVTEENYGYLIELKDSVLKQGLDAVVKEILPLNEQLKKLAYVKYRWADYPDYKPLEDYD